eukprot:TRINITY_DN54860_c0_g1_i1.p1 TRINITY_DN54860_c0_g1~~TRINITY_DN54860_c0_g1_i1.p1  ORF type:complete len:1168 (-),score=211.09 TRINITY_DN54860_c0_g1_i1:263-3583(-)
MAACAQGNSGVVAEALRMPPGLRLLKMSDMNGFSPLHFAAASGEVEVVRLLCENNANVSARSIKHESPLMVAAQRGHLRVVQYLCEKRNAQSETGKGCFGDGGSAAAASEYWKEVLPSPISEDAIPPPLSLVFLAPSASPVSLEQLNIARGEVLVWLLKHLEDVANPSKDMQTPRSHDVRADAGTPHSDARVTISSTNSTDSIDLSPKRGSEERAPSSWTNTLFPAGCNTSVQRYHVSFFDESAKPPWRSAGTRKATCSCMPDSIKNSAWRGKVRIWLRSRNAVIATLICLALALYVPDILVFVGVPDNLLNDVVLTVVMCCFFLELLLLSLVDSSYPLSFFFFMDCIGTFSMVTDISFMFGMRADKPQKSQSAESDLTFFKATRTAKIGARAGRLSRLVKIMRFLPSNMRKNTQAESLQQISNQLTNDVSKRVAVLTILLVIFMPLFTIHLYPDMDLSMATWVEAVARRAAEERSDGGKYLRSYIEQFARFYRGRAYGPYKVCLSDLKVPQALAGCQPVTDSGFEAPSRKAFQLDVSYGGVLASFDFTDPSRTEATMGIVLISLVIALMCGACLLLNYAATELAVQPLERMLSSIKGSARAIFTSVSALDHEDEEEEENEEDFAEDMDDEVALLERLVGKIATLAELFSQKQSFDEEAMKFMKSEELGVLALASTHLTLQIQEAPTVAEVVLEASRGVTGVTTTMQWQLEEIGLDYRVLNSWDFNVLELPTLKLEQTAAWLLMNNPGSCAYSEHNVDMQRLRRFVGVIANGYITTNFYHNFMHAVDVAHTVFRYMTLCGAEQIFSMIEEFAVLVASISHDVGHIGLNNGFLVEVQHDLAIRYNDRSPLENLHCCKLFEILAQPTVNVFSNATAVDFCDVRKLIIEVILHTDITLHPAMVKELELLYELNSRVFESSTAGGVRSEHEVEILTKPENKRLAAKLVLHSADTSNPKKQWHIAKAWAWRVLDEYAEQGDEEKKLGIPVQMLNDREKVDRPSSQIGFIEFIVAPLAAAELKIFPGWHETRELLEQNLLRWQDLWIEESEPTTEDEEKMRDRVHRMVQKLDNNTNDGKRQTSKMQQLWDSSSSQNAPTSPTGKSPRVSFSR